MFESLLSDPQNISCDYLQYGSFEHHFDAHLHRKICPYTIWAQATEGSYEICCGDGRHEKLECGQAFLTGANLDLAITHHGCADKDFRMCARWLHIHITLFGAIDITSLLDMPLGLTAAQCEGFAAIHSHLAALNDSDIGPITKIALRQQLAYEILEQICRIAPLKSDSFERLDSLNRLGDVLKFMRENIARKLNVSRLAKIAHLSEPHFYVLFKAHTNHSPMNYFKGLKLSAACKLLLSTDMPLAEIADNCGFCNEFHLSRDFRRAYNISPGKYRKLHLDNLA